MSQKPFAENNLALHVGDAPADVMRNRRGVAASCALDLSSIAGVAQVHGADVWVDLAGRDAPLDRLVRWDNEAHESLVEADALITARPHHVLAVAVADCLPIAVTWGRAHGAIHAGWRGLAGGVIEAAVAALRRAAGGDVARADVTPAALIGPALGVCCFAVGEEVAAQFDPESIERGQYLNARADADRRLRRAGFEVEHIGLCTSCDSRLFSHRGDDGRTGRQALLVGRFGNDQSMR